MKLLGIKILKINTPLKNHCVFTLISVETFIKEHAGKELVGVVDSKSYHADIPAEEIAFKCTNLRLAGDELLVDIEILKTPQGQVLVDLLETGLDINGFRTVFTIISETRGRSGMLYVGLMDIPYVVYLPDESV